MARKIVRFCIVLVVLVAFGSGCSDDEASSCDTGDTDGSVTEDTSDASTNEDASVDERTDASTPVGCEGSTVSELCTQFCEAFCQNQELLCIESECQPDDCAEGGEIFDTCTTRCADADCARDLCEAQGGAECESFGTELASGSYESLCLNRDPSCVIAPDLGCSDVCGSTEQVGGDLVDNGVCEDGSEDSVSAACTRGSDCTDCGPQLCSEPGGSCVNHGDCCGFHAFGALCVDPDGQSSPMQPICFPSCDDTHPCPEGFHCNPTTGTVDVCIEQ
jgi:hypothetical protein